MDILLVGANPDLVEHFSHAAARRGHALAAWPTTDAALQAHRQRPFDFVALTCPPSTPSGLGAWDFCREVRRVPDGDLVHLLVVLDPCCADQAQRALDAGASSCVLQPVSLAELDLRVMVAEWRVAEYAARSDMRRALQRSEARSRTLFDAMPDMVFRFRADGTTLDFKPGRQLGPVLPPEAFIGRRIQDVMPEPVGTLTFQHIVEALTKQDTVHYEYRLAPIADDRHFEARIVPSGQDEVFAIVREITDRKRDEAGLRRRLDVEAAMAEVSRRFVPGDVDLEEILAILGRAVRVDRAYIFEFRKHGEVIDNTFEWCAPGSPPLKHVLQNLQSSNTPWAMRQLAEFQTIVVPSVAELPPEAAPERVIFERQGIRAMLLMPIRALGGGLAGYVGFDDTRETREWTEDEQRMLRVASEILTLHFARLETERALRRSETNFRMLTEATPEAVVVHHDGLLVYVNPAAARMFAVASPDQLLGRRVLDFVHPDDHAAVRERLGRARTSEGPLPVSEERLLRRDGTIALAEVAAMPVTFDGVRSVLIIARDVSEERKLAHRLQFADRMVSVGRLAAGVAHEVNNPLAYLMGNLEFVAAEVSALRQRLATLDRPVELAPRLAELGEAVAAAADGAERVRKIVRDLKAFSRPDEDRPGPVDLREVLEVSVSMAWHEIRHRSRLMRDWASVDGQDALVEASETRLGQVFVNLLVNAAHAVPEGAPEQHEIRVSLRRESEWLVAVIADTGVGIDAEVLPHVFEPFFTTKPVGVGTGLGLSICHGIVTGLGGEISVESRRGRGTKVRVALRPWRGSHRQSGAGRSSVLLLGNEASRRRVLVVDDEVLIGKMVTRVLGAQHEVMSVTTAKDALRALDAGREFDVILCDLMMPEMTGMDLHAELLTRHPNHARRMVFLSGGAFTDRSRAFLESVDNPRLDKPVSAQTLRRTLEEVAGTEEETT
jgi:two-component system NtrC family sensor kinase